MTTLRILSADGWTPDHRNDGRFQSFWHAFIYPGTALLSAGRWMQVRVPPALRIVGYNTLAVFHDGLGPGLPVYVWRDDFTGRLVDDDVFIVSPKPPASVPAEEPQSRESAGGASSVDCSIPKNLGVGI